MAHEFAAHHLTANGGDEALMPRASWRGLAFRKLIGDPFDLNRRALMGAIGTLTIRGGGSPAVLLHHRDSSRVAGGGGMVHLLPAGIFQPSSVFPVAVTADFSIWRNIHLDALTLAGDILTVAFIDPHLYDELFTNAVQNNAEGSVPVRAVPFEEHTLAWLRRSWRLSPGAAAALHLAWTHRKILIE